MFPESSAPACWSDADCENTTVPQCKKARCDFNTGQCIFEPDPALDGQACDDNNACTLGDRCVSGMCSGTDYRSCDDDNFCTTDRCDPRMGCQHSPTNENQTCDDHNPCTRGEKCVAGECTGGQNTCICQSDIDCAPFEDNNLCNGLLICDPIRHVCAADPNSVVTCPPANDLCQRTKCIPATGECETLDAPDGTACDDFDPCTMDDKCMAGQCLGTAKCQDNNPCTRDLCDPLTGACTFDSAAMDGRPCGPGFSCRDGECASRGDDYTPDVTQDADIIDGYERTDTTGD